GSLLYVAETDLFSFQNSFVRQYVVLENNHYKTVDGIVLLLHDEDVPRSGALVTRLSKLV
ncbi:hypothetical protein, partial [Pseudomonas sp. Sample_9]|uniref:hypothetical protein n=1 Tax=Pseudomonas sp. Sample_9 TaxID=2382158 RepID=UPI0019D5C94E